MRVVVVGATGNVGTSVLRSLAEEPRVEEIVGLARRLPSMAWPKTSWVQADIARDDLGAHFAGADAVVHLAWLIQPARDMATLRATNVEGSARVFHAAGAAGVGTLVYASSVGAYSPGPKDHRVDESWPTDGVETSFYSRHKAEVERMLDRFEHEFPGVRVVRLRPGLAFKREAAAESRRYFAAPLLPAPPASADARWRMRLQPSPVGWVDMALSGPLMDTTRAREELGWEPHRTSGDALLDLLHGIRDGSGGDTPPLDPGAGGPLRVREI